MRLVRVDLADQLQIRASIDENSHYQPLSVCTRAGYSGWVFTQKRRSCEGHIHIGAKKLRFKTKWRAGRGGIGRAGLCAVKLLELGQSFCILKDGCRLGFNLAAGVNETGFSENCLWLDDRPIKIDMVDFRFDRYQKHLGWQLKSHDGILDLHFLPKASAKIKPMRFLLFPTSPSILGNTVVKFA